MIAFSQFPPCPPNLSRASLVSFPFRPENSPKYSILSVPHSKPPLSLKGEREILAPKNHFFSVPSPSTYDTKRFRLFMPTFTKL